MWPCCLSQCGGFLSTLGSRDRRCWLWFAFACQEFPMIALLLATAFHILHFVHQWHESIVNVNNLIQVLRPFARQWSLFQNARSSCHSNIITHIELRCCVLYCHVGWFCLLRVQDVVVPNVSGCISGVSVLPCIVSTNGTIAQIEPHTFRLIDWMEPWCLPWYLELLVQLVLPYSLNPCDTWWCRTCPRCWYERWHWWIRYLDQSKYALVVRMFEWYPSSHVWLLWHSCFSIAESSGISNIHQYTQGHTCIHDSWGFMDIAGMRCVTYPYLDGR